jgi:hypothetical protein
VVRELGREEGREGRALWKYWSSGRRIIHVQQTTYVQTLPVLKITVLVGTPVLGRSLLCSPPAHSNSVALVRERTILWPVLTRKKALVATVAYYVIISICRMSQQL